MIRAVVGSKKADEQVVVALGGDGKGEGLGQSLARSRPVDQIRILRGRCHTTKRHLGGGELAALVFALWGRRLLRAAQSPGP